MKAFWIFCIAATSCLLVACGPKQQAVSGTDSTATTQEAKAPSEQWLVLKYDDMRLRETPGKAGKVLATLKEGSEVLDLDERSEATETVELRGESITAAWWKVRAKDGMEGWIFGGALQAAAPSEVAEFAAELQEFATGNCASIQKVLDLFAESFMGKSTTIADQAMVPLTEMLDDIVTALNFKLGQRPPAETKGLEQLFYKDPPTADDPKALAERKAWETCGLVLDYPEGILTLSLKPGLLLPTVGTLVSDPMRQYLQIRKKEEENSWAVDASLTISPKDLADRALTWDKFLQDNPDFVFKQSIRQQNKYYIGSLLMGQDNGPVFDYDTKKMLNEEFKAAWEWVLKTNPQSNTGKIVQEWVNMVKPAGWKMTPKSEKYIQDYWGSGE